MKIKRILLPLAGSLGIAMFGSSCYYDGYNPGAKTGAVAGGLIGAGVGTIVGSQSGRPLEGAAIGGAVGAAGGALLGSARDDRYRYRSGGYHHGHSCAPARSYHHGGGHYSTPPRYQGRPRTHYPAPYRRY